MKNHTAFVRFRYHESKWIIIRRWRLPLYTREPFAPGFVLRRIECICSRPHLHDDGVKPVSLVPVEQANKFNFLRIAVEIALRRPVNIIDSCNPNTAELRGSLGNVTASEEQEK